MTLLESKITKVYNEFHKTTKITWKARQCREAAHDDELVMTNNPGGNPGQHQQKVKDDRRASENTER